MKPALRSQTNQDRPLRSRVAMLLGATDEGGCSLVLSLARLGADIVLVYHRRHGPEAGAIRQRVQALGRRCLLIPAGGDGVAIARWATRQTVRALGQLDIFIDYGPVFSDKAAPVSNRVPNRGANWPRADAPLNLVFLAPALNAMVVPGPSGDAVPASDW